MHIYKTQYDTHPSVYISAGRTGEKLEKKNASGRGSRRPHTADNEPFEEAASVHFESTGGTVVA